jgi:hypothetical protein
VRLPSNQNNVIVFNTLALLHYAFSTMTEKWNSNQSVIVGGGVPEAFCQTSIVIPVVEGEGCRRNGAVDTDILHVFEEALIPTKPQRQLATVGIRSVKDILARRNEFKHGDVGDVHKPSQERMYNFCLWYENFHQRMTKGVLGSSILIKMILKSLSRVLLIPRYKLRS